MKNAIRFISLLLTVLIFSIVGCTGGGTESTPKNSSAEDVYSAGFPVPAVKASEAAIISLFVKGQDGGGFTAVTNGMNMLPGTYTLGVKAEGGAFGRGRIFVADGGGYQVEATLNGSYYTCQFKLGDNMTCPILIQEIYSSGFASKAKYAVFTVTADKLADKEQLVRNSIAMVIGQDIMDSITSSLTNVLNNAMYTTLPWLKDKLEVKSLKIKAPAGGKDVLASAGVTIKVFNLTLPQVKTTDLVLSDVDVSDKNKKALTVGFTTPILKTLIKVNDLRFSLSPLSFNFNNTKMFLDANALSSDFTGSIALGAGLYIGSALNTAKEFTPPATMDNSMITPDGTYNVGVGISQYNLNQILTPFVNGMAPLVITDPAILNEIKFAIPGIKGGVNQALSIDMSKALVAVDFSGKTPRAIANDVRASYTENGSPMWTMSLDLVIDLKISSQRDGDDTTLSLKLEPLADLSHTHLMMDNTKNLGIFDHSKFVIALVNGLAGKFSSLPISDLLGSMVALKNVPEPIKNVECKDGYLYLNVAADSVDLSGLLK